MDRDVSCDPVTPLTDSDVEHVALERVAGLGCQVALGCSITLGPVNVIAGQVIGW